MRTLTTIIMLALSITIVHAGIYKCRINGKLKFSDQPCSGELDQPVYRQTAPITQSASQPKTTSVMPNQAAIRLETEYFGLDDKYILLVRDRDKIKKEQEAKLTALRLKKQRAANNRAGANWEQSISTEMAAIVELYTQKINRANEMIDRTEKERDEVKAKLKELKTVYY